MRAARTGLQRQGLGLVVWRTLLVPRALAEQAPVVWQTLAVTYPAAVQEPVGVVRRVVVSVRAARQVTLAAGLRVWLAQPVREAQPPRVRVAGCCRVLPILRMNGSSTTSP